jgi:hypothetical protein
MNATARKTWIMRLASSPLLTVAGRAAMAVCAVCLALITGSLDNQAKANVEQTASIAAVTDRVNSIETMAAFTTDATEDFRGELKDFMKDQRATNIEILQAISEITGRLNANNSQGATQ